MKQHFLFVFFIINFIRFIETAAAADVYHGNLRQWTLENNGTTYIGLHILKEPAKLIFPKEKIITELLSGLKLDSSSANGNCEDTKHELNFTLKIADQNDIHGKIKVISHRVRAYLYEKCNGDERPDHYSSPSINNRPAELEDRGRDCYKTSATPFQIYDKNDTKHFMELIVSGSFKCQVFLELPQYMKLEDIKLIDKGRLELNETFVGQNASFWWKSKNDAMLPSGIFFDSFNNVQINILNSSKTVPYFLRIGSFQPLPSMKFKFDESCNGAEFELFINLQNTPDCQIRIHQVKEGFKFSTKSSSSDEFIKDPSLSPTLIMGKNGIYVKIASLLTIKSYPICNVSTPDVPADQFVIQISRIHKIACKKAEVTILKEDVANGIEILIDRSKIPLPTPAGILNSTVVSATAFLSAKAALEWWWFVAGGILLFLILCVALPILIICIYRRKKKQPTKKKIREVSKSIISDEIPIQPKKSKDQTKAKDRPIKKKSKSKGLQMENKESKQVEKKNAQDQKKDGTKENPSKNQESVEQPVAPRKRTKICDSFRERCGYQKESVVDEEVNVGGAADKEDPENPLPWYIRNMGVVYQSDPVADNKTKSQTTQNETTFSTVSTQNVSEKTQESTTGSNVDKAAPAAPKLKRKTSTQSNDRSSKITLEMK